MPCNWIRLPDGGIAHVRTSRTPRKRCSNCGNLGDKLCDFPLGNGKTCDRPLCGNCAIHREPDTDYCPSHPSPNAGLFPDTGGPA